MAVLLHRCFYMLNMNILHFQISNFYRTLFLSLVRFSESLFQQFIFSVAFRNIHILVVLSWIRNAIYKKHIFFDIGCICHVECRCVRF